MTIFPNAKINIGLSITGKRDDGYHNIESLFYPVGARDALEFIERDEGVDCDDFVQTGIETDCDIHENMVVKALNLLRKNYPIPPLRIHLHKAIPPGSGLGGGSSDAAFMIRYLNRCYRLGIEREAMTDLAMELGSDCAFFITNTPALVRGRGEIISETGISLAGRYIFIVHPGIHISTAEAYRMVEIRSGPVSITEKINLPPVEWKNNIINDFQEPVISKYPLIGEVIDTIYRHGAIYCSLSGSGSAVYGIFDGVPGDIFKDKGYWSWKGKL